MVNERRSEQLFSSVSYASQETRFSLPVLELLSLKAKPKHKHTHTNCATLAPCCSLRCDSTKSNRDFHLNRKSASNTQAEGFYFLTFVCLPTTFPPLSPAHLHRRRRGCNIHTLIFRLFPVGFSFSLFPLHPAAQTLWDLRFASVHHQFPRPLTLPQFQTHARTPPPQCSKLPLPGMGGKFNQIPSCTTNSLDIPVNPDHYKHN